MYIRLFRDAAPGDGGGGDNKPPIISLSDIEKTIQERQNKGGFNTDPSKKPPADIKEPDKKEPDTSGIKPGDGKDKLPDLADKDKIPEGKKMGPDGKTLIDDPEYKKPVDPPAGDEPIVEPDVNDPLAFWESVNKLTGVPVEVTYPEGIDPISPEGVVLRENAVRDQAVDTWEQTLKAKYPRAYAYMMHHMEGGSDEEFMNAERGVSLPERTKVEGNVELATNYYKQDLINKGVDADIVEAQIAKAVKENKILEKGLAVYDRIRKEQEQELATVEERNKQNNTRIDGLIKAASTAVVNNLPNLGFVVPDAQKEAFTQFVDDHMQINRETGDVFLVTKFDQQNPKAQLEALVFQFFKGDLSKVIQKKIQTQATQRLRQQAEKTKIETPKDQGGNTTKKTFVPLAEMGGPRKKD